MKKTILSFVLLVFLLVFSCKENKILSPDASIIQIEANLQGLNNLGDGFWYELWVLYEDGGSQKRQSAGVFTVGDNGMMSKSTFDVNLGYLQLAKGILVSIEEDNVPGMYFNINEVTPDSSVIDTIKDPSKYRILTGTLVANDGVVSIGNEFLLNFDFMSATGTYMLSTPTDSNNTNPKRGLWFVAKDTNDIIIPGLNLPDLPANWSYEGWVNNNGTILYTGRFSKPGAGDNTALYGDSTGVAFPFPGEDFIYPDTVTTILPADLSGLEIGISILLPYPKDANPPFTLSALTATIPTDVVAEQVYEMQNNVQTFPTGQIHVEIEIYE